MTTQTYDFEDFYELLDPPSVNALVGPRGTGKTGLSATISEDFHQHKVKVVWLTMSNIKALLPEYITNINARSPKWIPHTLTVMDDIHLEYHARKFRTNKAILLDTLISKSRQLDITFLITTQFSGRADINIFRGADNLLIKRPTKKMMKFDRSEMREFLKDAHESYKQIPYKDHKKYVYVSTKMDYEILIGPYPLPDWWTEELSTYLKKSRYSKKRKS